MNIWLHRISHWAEVSYPLLDDHNLLSIGFSDFSSQEFIDDCNRDGQSALDRWFKEMWGSLPRTRYNLLRFTSEMKAGDWVLVPSWGCFHLFEILEDHPHPIKTYPEMPLVKNWHGKDVLQESGNLMRCSDEGHTLIDLGLVRNVRVIARDISRNDYADAALTARMKIRSTSACITDLKDSVEKALEHFRKKMPINIHAMIMKQSGEELLKIIRSELDPDKFENLIKVYFEKSGASNAIIPSKNASGKEGDADIVASFDSIKTVIHVQAKFHKGNTGAHAVDQIKDYVKQVKGNTSSDDGIANIAWVVTSGDGFSDECQKIAAEANITLINGTQFSEMLLDVGLSGLGVV